MRRNCAVRHISADVLERAVLDFLQKCALHPDVIEKVVTKYESRRGIDGANLRAKLRAVEGTLQETGTKLRHCADLLTQGGLDSLTEEIRANAGLLHDEKRGLMIERELLTRELESKVVDPEHVRLALGQLGDLVDKLAGTERKKLVATFLSRVEVHTARGIKEIPGKRTVDVVVLLRLPQLVTGMSEGLIIDHKSNGHDDGCAALRFRISFNSTRAKRSIVIVAPFSADAQDRVRATGDIGIVATLERALQWQKRLQAQPGLKRTTLAAEAGNNPNDELSRLVSIGIGKDVDGFFLHPGHVTDRELDRDFACFARQVKFLSRRSGGASTRDFNSRNPDWRNAHVNEAKGML